MLSKNFFLDWTQYLLRLNIWFWPKMFWGSTFFSVPKFVGPYIFKGPKFYKPNIFWPTIFVYQTFFWPKIVSNKKTFNDLSLVWAEVGINFYCNRAWFGLFYASNIAGFGIDSSRNGNKLVPATLSSKHNNLILISAGSSF